jgi:L-rhamnose mutarotase
MKRYCLAVDLKDDPALITEYERLHAPGNTWPEIAASIRDSGILGMHIYRTGNRLFMIMETTDDFSFAAKAAMDRDNPAVQRWETLMWDYQQALAWAAPGEKWVLMNPIFELK